MYRPQPLAVRGQRETRLRLVKAITSWGQTNTAAGTDEAHVGILWSREHHVRDETPGKPKIGTGVENRGANDAGIATKGFLTTRSSKEQGDNSITKGTKCIQPLLKPVTLSLSRFGDEGLGVWKINSSQHLKLPLRKELLAVLRERTLRATTHPGISRRPIR